MSPTNILEELVNPLKIETWSKYKLGIPSKDFLLVGDALFTELFDTHFDTKTANEYNKVVSALKIKELNFNYTLIEL